MDKGFQKFLECRIDLTPVGVERRRDASPYFCTPKGASIFGWAGVDGIHFCFLPGFGETVFAVSPMNSAPDYVHPIAQSFTDFLRLLLSCGDVSALEQAWAWDEARFYAFLQDNLPTPEQQITLRAVASAMALTPMERPWRYIRALQASFDYSAISSGPDCPMESPSAVSKPVEPEWKVYFDGNFTGHRGRDRAGIEIPLNRSFEWAGHFWKIPSAYACSRGLVVDFCMSAAPEDIRRFMEKWNLPQEEDSSEAFSRVQQMQMDAENPLCLDFHAALELNGKRLTPSHGCAVTLHPFPPDAISQDSEAQWAADHYGLDPAYGWVIYRNAFPWSGKRRPEIHTLSLTMEQPPLPVPAAHFRVGRPGDTVSVFHPRTHAPYVLTVEKLEASVAAGLDPRLFPTHFTTMHYTLTPEPAEPLLLFDCAGNDEPPAPPSRVASSPLSSEGASSVGIIGGADGPTAILLKPPSPGRMHTAYSSLHFAPVQGGTEWFAAFSVQHSEPASILLL